MPRILVGNKADLVEERVVDNDVAKQFAEENGLNYFETSAFTGDGIGEMMADIMKQTFEYKVLPIINNPPPVEQSREQSFNLAENKPSFKERNRPAEDGQKPKSGGCCK